MSINFSEYDFPGTVNGESVESIADWFNDNPDYSGVIEIELNEPEEPFFRICVKKQMTVSPVLTNKDMLPSTQMVGRKVGTFAGFYLMELWEEDRPEVKWRGKVPKIMILQMEQI